MSSGSHTSNKDAGFLKNAGQVLILVVLIAVLAIIVNKLRTAEPEQTLPNPTIAPTATLAPTVKPTKKPPVKQTDPPATETPEIVVTPTPVPEFHPTHSEQTDPDNYVKQLAVNVDGRTLGENEPYEPEELIGKTCIAITNLPPRKMMGIDSCGMLISAVNKRGEDEELHLLMVDPHIPAGAKLY